ncbi:hypothetical protein HHI36_006310 [Cryptolaemus montrouzieri]|uniref:Uncharacterized protein n=1 Tax=Cryptolaemus montrouzieri TaxID=559131 RepID=A0ABD2NWV3_9CUCU
MEFSPLKETLKNFKFDIENIIDDWVLMGFLVGNDFIPNLPNLHIASGALPILYKAYMEVLPKLDGYINEGGSLNLKRFESLMKKLGEIDVQNFDEVRDNLLYMESKTGRKMQPFAKNNSKLRNLETWKPEEGEDILGPEFLECLEEQRVTRDAGLSALIKATEEEYFEEEDDFSDCDENEEDDEEFENYKRSYYMNKLEYERVTPQVMKSQAEGYVRAIQWNLHYYYNGVCSWSWFYPHHYAPFVSDIKNFENLELNFDIGKPFLPYEQLLAVLPAASKELLPKCYQKLMTEETSPIIKYYPENFDTDLNGKKQEWEAVVLVPFIDEDILLESMHLCKDQLSSDEARRNKHGPMLCYSYTAEDLGVYESPMYFSAISHNHAKLQPITIDEIRVSREKLVKGLYPGVLLDVYYPGFPTLKHLEYRGHLKKARVKVFEQASRNESIIIQVIPSERVLDAKLPVDLLGKTVYVGWPHLVEAKVVEVFNSNQKLVYAGDGLQPIEKPSPPTFEQEIDTVQEYYTNRLGIEFGKVLVLIKVKKMIGQKYMFTSKGRISLEKSFCENTSNYPLQLIVENINVYTESFKVYTKLEDIFPAGTQCFTLTHNEYYGFKGTVKHDAKTPEGLVCICITFSDEPNLSKPKHLTENMEYRYRTLYVAAVQASMSNYIFSRITGSFFVTARNREGGPKTVNLGLDLKFNKKNLETPGFTKKIGNVWYYTDAAIDAVEAYADEFPEVLEYIAKTNHNNHKDEILIEDIFPENSAEKVKAIQTWLTSQPHSRVERRACNSAVLDVDVVKEIEKIVDGYKPSNTKNVTLQCKPNLLYRADLCFGNLLPDPSVEVQLFDRIINVRPNHTVPYGLKGTIIGIQKAAPEASNEHMYDVIFDTKFEGGFEINSCSTGRGYRLPLNAFINISHGIRLYQPKSEISTNPSQMQREEYNHRKYQNYNSHNRNSNYVPNSAFAKFNNNQFTNAPHSYNAVPPFMPNGEPIYKSFNPHNQNYNSQTQKYQLYDYRNPFPKKYAPDSCPALQTNNLNSKNNSQKISSGESKVRQRGNTSKGITDSNKGKNPKEKIDFMPSFKKVNDPVEETANALKKILKINEQPHVENVQQTEVNISNVSEPSSQQSKDREHITSSITPYSVQLLSYYQSKGLGLPRYQYVMGDIGIQCQIKLPNRQIIIGPPAKTREDASECVAELALNVLNSKESHLDDVAKVMKESPKKFPKPPKQWWNHEQKAEKFYSSGNVNSSSNNNWRGLIPLQVVKKGKASSSTSVNNTKDDISEANKKNTRTVLSEKPENSSNENAQTIRKKEQKPRRQRKMRIAANFGMNP